MAKFPINTEEDFMSIKTGDKLSVTGFGSIAFGKYFVLSGPERSGNIPRVLVKSLEEGKNDQPPFFVHLLEGKLLTDENLEAICKAGDNSCIVVEREE